MSGSAIDGTFPTTPALTRLTLRRYDFTGLTEEQSVGLGWELPFHPDGKPFKKEFTVQIPA
jgi:hypothetical protein